MKNLVLVILMGFGLQAIAQNAAVTNAYMYQKDKEYEKARIEIDKAITNEKTMGNAKTWYYRGQIYEALATDPKFKDKAPADALKTAFDSYSKVLTLDKKGGEFYGDAERHSKGLYSQAFNAGVKSYNEKNYDAALKNYELATTMRPNDTTTYLYTAYAAEAKQDYATAKKNYLKALELGNTSRNTYNALIFIAKNIDKNEAETQKYVTEGLAKYPNDKNMMLEELSFYLKQGKGKEAIEKLKKAIELDPKNSNLYAVLGSIQDQSGNQTEAMANYQKAIDIDPNNFDAQYNMGVYQYNKAAEILLALDKLDYAQYQKVGKTREAEAKKFFEGSIPYFEKAHQLMPNDMAIMKSMVTAYTKVGRTEDVKKINAEMEKAKKPAASGGSPNKK
jgi:tetratricopeptide (TPR) repeat protein